MNFANSNCDDEISLEKELPFRLYSFHTRQELVANFGGHIGVCEKLRSMMF